MHKPHYRVEIINPVLQMSKLRHKGIKPLAQGHGDGTEKHRRDSNPVSLVPTLPHHLCSPRKGLWDSTLRLKNRQQGSTGHWADWKREGAG